MFHTAASRPRGGRLNRLRTRLLFRALVEKSPAIETRTIVHDYPKSNARTGSVPRRPTCPRLLTAEKSPAAETARYVPAPAHLPAVAHRRESPYNSNGGTRTRITDQANTLNATVIARSEATWQSPGREDLLAYTDKILACGGSPPGHLPAVAHRREIPHSRNGTPRTRASQMPARAPCRASQMSAVAHRRFTATVRSGGIRRWGQESRLLRRRRRERSRGKRRRLLLRGRG